MTSLLNELQLMDSFLMGIRSGNRFYYDSTTEEVLHVRRHSRGEKRLESDDTRRYVAFPDPSDDSRQRWIETFLRIPKPKQYSTHEWELFHAEKYSEFLLEWLHYFKKTRFRRPAAESPGHLDVWEGSRRNGCGDIFHRPEVFLDGSPQFPWKCLAPDPFPFRPLWS